MRLNKLVLALGLVGFLVTSCSDSGQKQDASTGYQGLLIPGVWESAWTTTLTDSINASNLLLHEESQIETLCPGYTQFADKRLIFWQQLMISLSWKESMHGPGNWIRFNGGTNEGLFQINPELKPYYRCEGLNTFDGNDNIKCAVKMAKKLVDREGSFLIAPKGGMSAYWAPLRTTSETNSKNRDIILGEVREACRTRTLMFRCLEPKSLGHSEHDHDEVDRSFNSDF